jgi:hypothetical protein
MTTTAKRNGKTISLTVEQKARMLTVIEDHPDLKANEIAVTSGSRFGQAYAVRHNGRNCTYCPCGAYTARCAHRVAGDLWLEARNRAAFNAVFNPDNIG